MSKKISKPVQEEQKPLTAKQKVYLKTLAETLDTTTAEQVSGNHKTRALASKKTTATLERILPKIKDLMDSTGLSDEYLLERLKRGLLAKKLVWSTLKEDWLEMTDWQTQMKALEIAFKLRGHLSNKDVEIDQTQEKVINVTFNLVKARSMEEIARLTDQTSIAKARKPVTEKPIEAEVVETKKDGKDIQ